LPVTIYILKPEYKPMYKPSYKPKRHIRPQRNRHLRMPLLRMPTFRMPKLRMPKFRLPPMRMPSLPHPRFPKFNLGRPSKTHESSYVPIKPFKLDYSGWQPIENSYSPHVPQAYIGPETPIITIEDVGYNSPLEYSYPALPASTGYAPEPITAKPNDYNAPETEIVYGVPQLVYEEPEEPHYQLPALPVYQEPSYHPPPTPAPYQPPPTPAPYHPPPTPAYRQPSYSHAYQPPQPQYQHPTPAPYQPSPPTYQQEASYSHVYQPQYQHPPPPGPYQQATYEQYHEPAPIEQPLFEYAPVQDLNSLVAALEYTEPEIHVASAPSPGHYQATSNAGHLAQEVQSGSVYVQHEQEPQPALEEEDEDLYYIFYDDQPPTAASFQEPLFYQNGPPAQSSPHVEPHPVKHVQPAPPQPYSSYQSGGAGTSSASYNLHVNGQSHGFSHNFDHS
jgi:hypothetical protein